MKKEDLRIVYMGTPDFAVEALRQLVEGGYNVVGVITMPDKPAGRGHKIQYSPVKQYALERNLPLLQPEKLKDEAFVEALREWKADLQIVVAFRMLPEVVWNMPRLGPASPSAFRDRSWRLYRRDDSESAGTFLVKFRGIVRTERSARLKPRDPCDHVRTQHPDHDGEHHRRDHCNFNLPFSVGKGDICRIVYLERQERRNVSMEKKNGKTMKGLPISERPYEKVLEKGPVSLSDAELLSVILRSGTKNIPVRDMAEEILNAGNPPGLAGLLHGTVEDYKEIRGVGEVKAIQLACIGELSARIWKAAASEKTIVFDAPSKVAAFYMEEMRHLEQENLKLLLLNTKNILLRDITVSRGTVNASCATPREIYIEALRFRACGIILLHNHPSGDPAPSREDCLFTERVREAGSLMGVPLLDHIIIGDNSYVSLRERGIFET